MCAAVENTRDAGRKDAFVNLRLEPEMHQEFLRLARENERTLSGEIRLAMRRYLDDIAAQVAA